MEHSTLGENGRNDDQSAHEFDATLDDLDLLREELQKTRRFLQEEREQRQTLEKKFWILEQALETMQLGITISDSDGTIVYTNPADARMHGYSEPDELLGQNTRIFAPPETQRQMSPAELEAMKNWVRESLNITQNGRRFPVYLTSNVVKDREGQFLAAVTTCEDITERKQAEEALLEERNLLRALIDHLPDHVFVKDTEGRFLLNNTSHMNFLQVDRTEELIGSTVFDFFPEELATQYQESDRQVLETGDPLLNLEQRSLAPDGTSHHFLTTKIPLQNRHKQIIGLVGICHNITKRKQTEQAIRDNERWLTATLNSLGEAVVTTDEKGFVTFFNPAAETLTEWKREEVIGRDLAFKVVQTDIDIAEQGQITQSFRQKITVALGLHPYILSKQGRNIPIEYNGNPIRDENGRYTGFVFVFRDITQRIEAEEELERSFSLLRSTLESTADGILALDKTGKTITSYNQNFAAMWQLPPSALQAQQEPRVLTAIADQLQHAERFHQAIKDAAFHPEGKQCETIKCLDGRIMEMVLQPQKLGKHQVGTVMSFRDVTERFRAEEALQYRISFGELIHNISTHFIHLGPADDLDGGIYRALQSIGEYTGVDHGYVAWFAEHDTRLEIWNEWWAEHIPVTQRNSRGLEATSLEWVKEYILEHNILHIPHIATLLPELEEKKDEPILNGIQSLIVIPLVSVGHMIGMLCFESLEQAHEWPNDIIALLRIVAEVFASASERKRTEEALVHERKRLFALFDNLPMYVFLQGTDRTIRFANRFFRERFGEPETRNCYKMLWGREALSEEGRIFEVLQKRSSQRWEWNHYPSTRIYQVYDYPFTDIDGAPMVLEFGVDITEQKQMELELKQERASLAEKVEARTAELSNTNFRLQQEIHEREQAQFELEQAMEVAESANRAKSEFLANMSHELRTPLNAILGYAQVLRNDQHVNERQYKGLSIIKSSGEHLLNLINEILDLSKIEAGQMELHLAKVHFPDFLRHLTEIIQIRARQKHITFVFQEDQALPEGLWIDEKRLRQILINLLDNAVKFTDRGRVVLHVTRAADVVPEEEDLAWLEQHLPVPLQSVVPIRFEIEDTGMGIAPDKIDEIFLPFQQVSEKSYLIEGTGLGLTICTKLVKMMHSQLDVKSVVGKGTSFSFQLLLPEVSDFLPKLKPPRQKIVGYTGVRRTVLIVDDKKENREVLRDMLAPLGFSIMEAENGQQGLDNILTHAPDVTLLDLKLPLMSGIQVVTQTRKTPKFQKNIILAVSASVHEDVRQQCLRVGFNDFLMKPVKLDELLQKLQDHLALEWIYEKRDSPDEMPPARQETSSMVCLPGEDIQTLRDLTLSGRVKQLLLYLNTLDETQPAFHSTTAHIRQLAKRFQLKAIEEFLHTVEDHDEH